MKTRAPKGGEPALPVDVDRLRKQFPRLTDDDVAAYVSVTRRIMTASPGERARITREVLARARAVRDGASPRDDEDTIALRYLLAVEKLQGR